MSNNKPRSSKPYDPNNSFVKKVASRVSGLIPKSTSWLSGWFSPAASEQEPSDRVEQINNEEEQFEDALEKPPPTKRLKVTANQQYVDYTRCQSIDPGEGSSRLVPNNFIDTSAIPGPSGLGARSSGFVASTPAGATVWKEPAQQERLEPKANGDDCSESGESTSGCSSLEPQINRGLPSAQTQLRQNDSLSPRKHLLDEKLNCSYLQNSRSLFLDRTSNSRNNQTVGRRNNPSFCVNTFGTPLFGERGSVNDLILNSPFYSGRTTYGGASSASYRRSLGSASLSSSPANSEKLARHTIKVKPGSNQSTADTSMSQTAKRILATLEQFSTPILDAKRIPVSQEPVLATLGNRKRSRLEDSGNSQLLLEQSRVPKRTSNKPLHWAKGAPSTSQLTIPVAPDTLIHRRREIVPELTSVSASLSISNTDKYKLRVDNEDSHPTRNTLKMKPNPRLPSKESKEPEMASEVNLPEVPLPISTLPTFDISVPAPKLSSQTSSVVTCGSVPSKKPLPASWAPTAASTSSPVPSCKLSSEGPSDASFSFSSPISVSAASKDQPILSPVNDFTFSKPLPAKFSEPSPFSVNPRPKAIIDSQKKNDSVFGGCKPASELKSGSVMDILGKGSNAAPINASPGANGSICLMDKFKPAAGTWECEKCLIRNKSDVSKCAACTNPREAKTQTNVSVTSESKTTPSATPPKVESGFGMQFKMAQGMWECSACMVRNKELDSKCVSCTTPKPGAATPKPASPSTSFSGWGDKFKPVSGTWECTVCMVRNGPEISACQSCTTKKPGSVAASNPSVKSSWGDQFKKPEGSWTCNDCMVTNKSADLSCVACSAKKPGTETAASSPKPNSQFSFGIPAPGKDILNTSAFSFGIPKDTKETSEGEKSNVSSSTGFKFGESKPDASAAKFTFGVPPASTPATQMSLGSSGSSSGTSIFATSPSTKPTISATPVENRAADVKVSQSSSPAENSKPTFSFGIPASSEGKPNAATPTPLFSFSKPPASTVTSQPASSSGSPLGGKRKLGDDAPSSSATPFKFGSGTSQSEVSQVKLGVTSTSSVSSTSGPVFSFSSASTSSGATSTLLNPTVTSTANGLNTVGAPMNAGTNSIFGTSSSASSSPASKPAFSFGLGLAAAKDESVSSTWKPPVTTNTTNSEVAKPTLDGNGALGKPQFTFVNKVSSSGMAFGSNAISAAPTFPFGSSSEKTAATSKPAIAMSFGSPASSAPLFGSGSSNLVTAVPSFGSTANHSGFGSLNSSANPSSAFPTTNSSNSLVPSLSSPTASAFSAPAEEKKPSFNFLPTEVKKPAGFNFSAPDEKKANFSFGGSADDSQKTAAFSFTATASATTKASSSSVFTFGAGPATNGPAKTDPAFGGNQPLFSFHSQPAPPPSSAGFSFGAPAPAFGAADVNAAPVSSPFGAPSFSPSATFNSSFGSANTQPSSGFNFSAAPTSGFGAQNQPSAGAFNCNVGDKPTFSFASGGFTAPSQDAPGATRRIVKKAIRRNVPR